MPTYEYLCSNCGLQFEYQQSIHEKPLSNCPECHGAVQRLVTRGIGFFSKGGGESRISGGKNCSLTETGTTCCGHKTPCSEPACGKSRQESF